MPRLLFLLVLPLLVASCTARPQPAQLESPPPSPSPGHSLVGLPAPGFVLETLDGRELALSDLRGKPVVMNFWASWCVPCRAEAPTLAEAARVYRGRVHFLGVNVLDDLPSARRFVQQYSWPFPSVVDEDGSVLRLYRVVGLPTTAFLTPHGRVARFHAGPFVGPEGRRRLHAFITELLAMP